MALGKLDAEINRRAVEGVDHPIIYKGEITATYKQYSDNLLMFRAKRLDPEYRENPVRAPEGATPPVTQIVINLAPGVEWPAEVVEAEEYRGLPPSPELAEGDAR